MLKAANRSCGWTKGRVRRKKHGGGMMFEILLVRSKEAKKKPRRVVYQVKCKAEKKQLGNIMERDDQKVMCLLFQKGW